MGRKLLQGLFYQMNQNHHLLIILLAVFCFSFEATVQGQDEAEFAVEGVFFRTTEFYWSSDSLQFAFYDYTLGSHVGQLRLNADSAGWQMIDIPTATLSSGSISWPLQPNLTAEEENLINPYEFIYQSPDGNLLFFTQNVPEDTSGLGVYYPLSLYNRSTGQLVTVSLGEAVSFGALGIPFVNPSFLNVMWSEDSHALAFTTMRISGTLQVWHLAIPDFENISNHSLQRFELAIHNVLYGTTVALEDALLDISSDGQAVLLVGRDLAVDDETRSFYDSPPELIIWYPYEALADIVATDVIVQNFMQATFALNDDKKLWLMAEFGGLFLYDLLTEETTPIRNDFDTNRSFPLFSPNGAWLTIVGSDEIRFIPMAEAE